MRYFASLALFAGSSQIAAAQDTAETTCAPQVGVSEAALDAAAGSRPTRLDVIRSYLAARRSASSGNRADALQGLQLLDRIGAPVLPGPQEPFAQWSDDPEFAAVIASMRKRMAPTRNGRLTVETADPPVTAEGIAYDPVEDRLFLTNWFDNAIYTLSREGRLERYFALPELTPNGIAVDGANHLLWFVATDAFRTGSANPRSELWRIDLQSGERTRFEAGRPAGFNDVAVSPYGFVYTSDTTGNAVWSFDPKGGLLAPVDAMGTFQRPNGLAVDDEGRFLFVAQGLDLLRIDLFSGEASEIALPSQIEVLATDGLYFKNGRLYAIQNFLTPGTIVEIALDEEYTRATYYRVLDRANPAFDLPTTGTFVGNEFWVMAGTQLYLYGAGREPAANDIRPLRVLAYPICE